MNGPICRMTESEVKSRTKANFVSSIQYSRDDGGVRRFKYCGQRPTPAAQLLFLRKLSTLNASRNLCFEYFLPIATTNLRLHMPLSYIVKAFSSGSTDQALLSPQADFKDNTVSTIKPLSSTWQRR